MTDKPGLEIRHSGAEIRDRVADLARRIEARLAGEELLVVGVLRGSAIFLADLVRELHLPVGFEFIDVTREDEADEAGEPQTGLRFFRHFKVEGRNVLVLKDVVSTGVVENYLLAQLRSLGPKTLDLACVVDRPNVRRAEVERVDALFHEPDELLWVGYGLDSTRGSFAHLPDLAVVTSSRRSVVMPSRREPLDHVGPTFTTDC